MSEGPQFNTSCGDNLACFPNMMIIALADGGGGYTSATRGGGE